MYFYSLHLTLCHKEIIPEYPLQFLIFKDPHLIFNNSGILRLLQIIFCAIIIGVIGIFFGYYEGAYRYSHYSSDYGITGGWGGGGLVE
jgi:hypothetical protein